MTIPTGQGQACGPESADPMGTPLPGSRPDRAAANDRRYASFLGSGPPKDQGGFGTEDMENASPHMNEESVRPSDIIAPVPDLAAMGDASQTFGGMMAQPQPPSTRQSGPQAKEAPKDALHTLKPGGPIKPAAQGFVNPGPTKNLRGVEPNTAMHRGTPNPEQKGTEARHGDHNPGMGESGHDYGEGINAPMIAKGRHSEAGKKLAPPPPDPRGVRK